MKTSLLIALGMMVSLPVFAESLSLVATDGTTIDVGYAKSSTQVPGDSFGTSITGLAFKVSNEGQFSTAVLTVNCYENFRSGFQYSVSCTKDASGWIHVTSDCTLDSTSSYTKNYFRNTFWHLVLEERQRNGASTQCGYELSVVRDGEWLSDSVNKTHNFKLNF